MYSGYIYRLLVHLRTPSSTPKEQKKYTIFQTNIFKERTISSYYYHYIVTSYFQHMTAFSYPMLRTASIDWSTFGLGKQMKLTTCLLKYVNCHFLSNQKKKTIPPDFPPKMFCVIFLFESQNNAT